MKNKPLNSALTFILCLVNLFLSFSLGQSFPNGIPVQINPVLSNFDRLEALLIDSMSTLANCTALEKAYPKERKQLLTTKTIDLAYKAKYNQENQVIAYTFAKARKIVLTDLFFASSFEDQKETLVHELLHIAGLPMHPDHNDGPIEDPVYILTRQCLYPTLGAFND